MSHAKPMTKEERRILDEGRAEMARIFPLVEWRRLRRSIETSTYRPGTNGLILDIRIWPPGVEYVHPGYRPHGWKLVLEHGHGKANNAEAATLAELATLIRPMMLALLRTTMQTVARGFDTDGRTGKGGADGE